MDPVELKIARIGNSRGVRLPAATLERYALADRVVMEERSDGILLRPVGPATPKLSFEETAAAMSEAGETWSEWDTVATDGLADLSWESPPRRHAAEPRPSYTASASAPKPGAQRKKAR